jgi:hypothetical protein
MFFLKKSMMSSLRYKASLFNAIVAAVETKLERKPLLTQRQLLDLIDYLTIQ